MRRLSVKCCSLLLLLYCCSCATQPVTGTTIFSGSSPEKPRNSQRDRRTKGESKAQPIEPTHRHSNRQLEPFGYTTGVTESRPRKTKKSGHLKNRWDWFDNRKPLPYSVNDGYDDDSCDDDHHDDDTSRSGKDSCRERRGSKKGMKQSKGKGKNKYTDEAHSPIALMPHLIPTVPPTGCPPRVTDRPSPFPSEAPSSTATTPPARPIETTMRPTVASVNVNSKVPTPPSPSQLATSRPSMVAVPIAAPIVAAPKSSPAPIVTQRPVATSNATTTPSPLTTTTPTTRPTTLMQQEPRLPSLRPTKQTDAHSTSGPDQVMRLPTRAPILSSRPFPPATTVVPTVNAVNLTASPTGTATMSPTRVSTRQSTPFTISFILPRNTTFTETEFAEARNVTLQFLRDFVLQQFQVNVNGDTKVDEVVAETLDVQAATTAESANVTVVLDLVFSENATFVPTTDEVDTLIAAAFLDSAQTMLLVALEQGLAPGNPFANVTAIYYHSKATERLASRVKNRTTSPSLTPPPVEIDDNDLASNSSITNGTLPPVVILDDATRLNATTNSNLTTSSVDTDPRLFHTSPPLSTDSNDIFQRYSDAKLKVSPFAIRYFVNDRTDSRTILLNDVDEVARVTLSYLDSYLRPMFDSVQSGSYGYLAGFGVQDETNETQVDFLASVDFSKNFSFNISQHELDLLVATAFHPPFTTALLSSLQTMSRDNPFSMTSWVDYQQNTALFTDRSNSVSRSTITYITVTLLVTVLFTGLLISISTRRQMQTRVTLSRKIDESPGKHRWDTVYGDLVESAQSDTSSAASSGRQCVEKEEEVIEFLTTSETSSVRYPLFQ